METIKFKTNIKCEGCIAKVTPFLNETVGKDNWQVDIQDPSKILTVKTALEPATVTQAIGKAGYKGEKI